VLVDDADGVVALVDVDGAEPFTLFIENLDQRASFMTVGLFNSKNANLVFTAATAGPGGNTITVRFTTAAGQAFSVSVVGDAITINLACDAAGVPNSEKNFARAVMDAVNTSGPASALVTAKLAPGSDGSAQCDTAVAATNLAGGSASDALASVEVAVSSLPPDQTPASGWITNTQAGTSIGAVGANTVKGYEFATSKTGPAGAGATELSVFRGLRVRASIGAYETFVVAAGVAKKKSV